MSEQEEQNEKSSVFSQTPPNHNLDYPVSEQFKVLDGHDIYRSNKLIVALVVVESNLGRDLRMYRWQLRNNSWKVDLCRMSVANWEWENIASKAKDLIQKYQIKRGRSGGEAQNRAENGNSF